MNYFAGHSLSRLKSYGLKVKILTSQLGLTPCDSQDCSPPGSSVRGILQTRILEWVDILFSRGSSNVFKCVNRGSRVTYKLLQKELRSISSVQSGCSVVREVLAQHK